ncbi:MAG: hypothetical protein QM760_21915 [Nibricoccus sp.]
MDVDSDNDNGLSAPSRSVVEDEVEDIEDDPAHPGKVAPTNRLDADHDDIPGFADGFDLDTTLDEVTDADADNQDSGATMVPVVLSIPPGTNVDDASLILAYDASDPSAVQVTGAGTDADPYVYELPESGTMRLWTGVANRTLAALSTRTLSANGTITDTRSFYVAPNTEGGFTWSTLQRLGFTKDSNGIIQNNTVTLYVEGVKPSSEPGDVRITVDLTSGGSSLGSDAVRLMFADLDLDVDSFSRNEAGPDRSSEEETEEDNAESRGKLVLVNDADVDADGVIDLADGFGSDESTTSTLAGGRLVPVVLQLPDALRDTATVMFNYSASDPLSLVTGEGWAKPSGGQLPTLDP